MLHVHAASGVAAAASCGAAAASSAWLGPVAGPAPGDAAASAGAAAIPSAWWAAAAAAVRSAALVSPPPVSEESPSLVETTDSSGDKYTAAAKSSSESESSVHSAACARRAAWEPLADVAAPACCGCPTGVARCRAATRPDSRAARWARLRACCIAPRLWSRSISLAMRRSCRSLECLLGRMGAPST